MSKFWHGLLHVGLVALQVANIALPYIAAPYNAEVAAAIGAVQGAVALFNHKVSGAPSDACPQ